MADLPIRLSPALAGRLVEALDREGKIGRALGALGPLDGRELLVVEPGPRERRELGDLGATIKETDLAGADAVGVDALVSRWSAFRGVDPAEIAAADRALRPGGRLLIVHDYGRDDVSRLLGDRPEYGTWSRRDGPFLTAGFRLRVVHCFWTFDTLDDAREFLATAFGSVGEEVGAGLRRPRLSYNVAVYHRSRP